LTWTAIAVPLQLLTAMDIVTGVGGINKTKTVSGSITTKYIEFKIFFQSRLWFLLGSNLH
jgi:hypothetical protein